MNLSTRKWLHHTAFAALLAPLWIVHAEGSASSASNGTVEGSVAAAPEKYLEETVVYLKAVPGQYTPKSVDMDQKGMKFIPHVLAVTTGDTVNFLNHDTVPHNVFSPEGGYNLGVWKPGETRSHKFDKTGAFSQLCNLHQEMLAYVFVSQNPYEAVVDSSGHFKIVDVPPGTYDVAIWNSHLKAPDQHITVAAAGAAQASFKLQR